MESDKQKRLAMKKPDWLKVRLTSGAEFGKVNALLNESGLDTVCRAANCPNRGECFGRGTATFLILGPNCTRNCRFCDVKNGPMTAPDPTEPVRVAEVSAKLDLKHIVITSVTRDDLPDGGAEQFAKIIIEIRKRLPSSRIEVLTPDFRKCPEAINIIIEAAPDIFNHNIETVPRLYSEVRPGADYKHSLELLRLVKERSEIKTKSGLMVGLGETTTELKTVFKDLNNASVEFLTIGQYLSPSANHLPVKRYYPPEEFNDLSLLARNAGINKVFAGPLVRSSYMADSL